MTIFFRYDCRMDYSAKGLQEWVREMLSVLSESPRYGFGTRTALHSRLVEMTGLSLTTIQKFHQGNQINLTVTNLDKLAGAVRQLQKSEAA